MIRTLLLIHFVFCLFYYFRGGVHRDQGGAGENGTVTGKSCPKGLYGTFCEVVFIVFRHSEIYLLFCYNSFVKPLNFCLYCQSCDFDKFEFLLVKPLACLTAVTLIMFPVNHLGLVSLSLSLSLLL